MKIKSSLKNYNVLFDTNITKFINNNFHKNDIFLIDKNLKNNNLGFLKNKKIIRINPDENKKEYNYLSVIIKKLIDYNFNKNNKIFSIGGGTIQDISSFISSIIFRGVNWIYIPTTLLSQADSCIGGKTSINFNNYKNIVGSFYPPSKIIINYNFLYSLNNKDYFSGIGEMLHFFAVSSEEDYLFFVNNLNPLIIRNKKIIIKYIKKCLLIKKRFIEKDEFDSNKRLILNYGHTFGHALESVYKYKIPHGIAVCHGMDISNFFSWKLGYLTEKKYLYMKKTIFQIVKNDTLKKVNINKFCNTLLKDKKTINNIPTFIFTRGPGKMFLQQHKLNNEFKKILINYFRDI